MKTVNRPATRKLIKDQLCQQIVCGALKPGTQLSPADLASEFGVSVTPAREALLELSAEGFVTSILARGFFVRALEANEVCEVYPIVGALEALALRSAIPSPRKIEQLKSLNQRLAGEASGAKKIELDERWHRLLVSDCLNTTLHDLLDVMRRRTYRYGYIFLGFVEAGGRSVSEHARVIECLETGDIEGAVTAVEANWRSGPVTYLPLLEQRGSVALTASAGTEKRDGGRVT
jgi:DNA-binding GntR family transcriptional regulator